jgi:D-alanyl-lipoteichoic acid acyltransferase DltB (MBOAT superfamily)
MQFNSLEYAIFLVAVLAVNWALYRARLLQLFWLSVASYLFYAASNPWFLVPMLASTVVDYWAGIGMEEADARGRQRLRKGLLVVSLISNLGLLAAFKYSNFFYKSFIGVFNLLDPADPMVYEKLGILLPAGISFYTFQTMSYTIDVYRRQLRAERSFVRFAFFVGYFPQLVAGPIVRAVDFLPQIMQPKQLTPQQASRALWLIGIGVFKKVAVADFLGVNLVQRVFSRPESYSSLECLMGTYAYSMQVYMDFSAYSDIAIGSALLFGYRLPDNFDRPYLATSVTDFWRRWHMTLGSWLRDYLYYPLGGARGSASRTYFNLFVTFILIGFWHGPDLVFIVYGVLHATAMCINRYFKVSVRQRAKPVLTAWGMVWRIFLTFNFIALCRILFRSYPQVQDQGSVLAGLEYAWQFASHLGDLSHHTQAITPELWLVLLGSFAVHWTPRAWVDRLGQLFEDSPGLLQGATVGVLLLASMLMASETIPFIYFQF